MGKRLTKSFRPRLFLIGFEYFLKRDFGDFPPAYVGAGEEDEDQDHQCLQQENRSVLQRQDDAVFLREEPHHQVQYTQSDGDADQIGNQGIKEIAVQDHRIDFPAFVAHHFEQRNHIVIFFDGEGSEHKEDARGDDCGSADHDVRDELRVVGHRLRLFDEPGLADDCAVVGIGRLFERIDAAVQARSAVFRQYIAELFDVQVHLVGNVFIGHAFDKEGESVVVHFQADGVAFFESELDAEPFRDHGAVLDVYGYVIAFLIIQAVKFVA